MIIIMTGPVEGKLALLGRILRIRQKSGNRGRSQDILNVMKNEKMKSVKIKNCEKMSKTFKNWTEDPKLHVRSTINSSKPINSRYLQRFQLVTSILTVSTNQ